MHKIRNKTMREKTEFSMLQTGQLIQILIQWIICILYMKQICTSNSFLSPIFATVTIKTKNTKEDDYR